MSSINAAAAIKCASFTSGSRKKAIPLGVAFAEAIGGEDRLNFLRREGAVEYIRFINQAVEEARGSTAAPSHADMHIAVVIDWRSHAR